MHRLLGPGYEARNYGVSGRTLLKKGDFPYWNENAYRQSREWNPDIVVIQLGTNDSKPQNWRHSTNFYSLNRVALNWPADWAGAVLQSATLIRETNTAWTVVEQLAVNDGVVVRVTNSVAGALRIYRLWQP